MAAVKAARALVALQLPGERAADLRIATNWVGLLSAIHAASQYLPLVVKEVSSLPVEAAKAGLVGPGALRVRYSC